MTDKLTKVHDTIWCCRSGSAADTQAVADMVQYYLGLYSTVNNTPPTTQTAASLFQEICYANKDMLTWVPPSCPISSLSFPPPIHATTTHVKRS